MNQWSRRSFILLAAVCLFGAFQIGRTWSQDENPAPERRGAEGRFQMIVTHHPIFVVFDTRTARGWIFSGHGVPGVNGEGEWKAMSSPFDVRKPQQEAGGDEPAKKFQNVQDQLKGQGDSGDEAGDKPNAANNPFRKIKTRIIDGKPRTNGQ